VIFIQKLAAKIPGILVWCFTPVTTPVTYESAETACNSVGGDLAASDKIAFLSQIGQKLNLDFWINYDVVNACSQVKEANIWLF
jgi:hypothetical protein